MAAKEERINEIHRRIEELDILLAQYVEPTSADNPKVVNAGELEYWSDRRDERRLLLEELDTLLKP
jgi:hypothetical protein